jgi:hypothetical protein
MGKSLHNFPGKCPGLLCRIKRKVHSSLGMHVVFGTVNPLEFIQGVCLFLVSSAPTLIFTHIDIPPLKTREIPFSLAPLFRTPS